MILQVALVAFGGTAALLAAVGFLGRSLVLHFLSKDIDRYRSELALAASEHSILLSRLQDRRAEVIGTLYGKIAVAIREVQAVVQPVLFAGQEIDSAGLARARDALIAAETNFDETQIWLTSECARRVENLINEARYAYDKFKGWLPRPDMPLPDALRRGQHEGLSRAWEVAREHLPEARQALEADMRSLITPQGRSDSTGTAAVHVHNHRTSGYWLHWAALVFEAFGSLLIFLEARRVSVQLATSVGLADYAGQPPPGFRDWWHNSGALGFGLLLAGILLTGVALFIDRRRG